MLDDTSDCKFELRLYNINNEIFEPGTFLIVSPVFKESYVFSRCRWTVKHFVLPSRSFRLLGQPLLESCSGGCRILFYGEYIGDSSIFVPHNQLMVMGEIDNVRLTAIEKYKGDVLNVADFKN